MAGYWDEAERTAETIDKDGYLHSGDLGEMDAHGYVKITGRIKDMIIRGGENIYPARSRGIPLYPFGNRGSASLWYSGRKIW